MCADKKYGIPISLLLLEMLVTQAQFWHVWHALSWWWHTERNKLLHYFFSRFASTTNYSALIMYTVHTHVKGGKKGREHGKRINFAKWLKWVSHDDKCEFIADSLNNWAGIPLFLSIYEPIFLSRLAKKIYITYIVYAHTQEEKEEGVLLYIL